jgi:hypothetical protein
VEEEEEEEGTGRDMRRAHTTISIGIERGFSRKTLVVETRLFQQDAAGMSMG